MLVSGESTGCTRDRAAASQNQPPMCDSTASEYTRSLPTREMRTGAGTFPARNPGILTRAARSVVACSIA